MHPAFATCTTDDVVQVDLGPIDPFDERADWSGRDVTADEFRQWLLTHASARRIVVRGVRIGSDAADTPLDLSDLRLDTAIVLQACRVESSIAMTHAVMGRLELVTSVVRGGGTLANTTLHGGLRIVDGTRIGAVAGCSIDASNADIRGTVEIGDERTTLDGALRLVGARIGGLLGIHGGAQIHRDPASGQAVDADGLDAGHGVVVHGERTRLDGALRLVGATIGGQLAVHAGARIDADHTTGWAINADGITISQDLFVQGQTTRLAGAIRLVGASIGGQLGVSDGARIDADQELGLSIDADAVSVQRSLFVGGPTTRLRGGLRLVGARIGGQLTIHGGARVGADSANGCAVNADALVVSSVFVQGAATRLAGEFRLVSAHIAGQFSIRDGAQIDHDNTNGWAVNADSLTVRRSLFVGGEGTRLRGALRLVGARVDGQFAIFGGVQVEADRAKGRAVDADGLTVGQDVFAEDTTTRLGGTLRLAGARIDGQLTLRREVKIAGDVDLRGASVDTLKIEHARVERKYDLSDAKLGRLDDIPQAWEQVREGWRLAGITLDGLSGTLHDRSVWSTAQRINWLRSDEAPSRRPFTQVADLYRHAGHREQARKVAIAGETATSSRWRRAWFGWTVGYGYAPWRAAIVAVLLVAFSWLATAHVADDVFVPADRAADLDCPDDIPCPNRLLYLTETVIPLIDLGQRDVWRVNPRTPYAGWLRTGEHLLDGTGWLLSLLLLGAVSGVVRKD